MGILDASELATSIYQGFAGQLLSGTIRNYQTPESGALDEYGDPIEISATPQTIEGFTEQYDASYRARAGIPETDLMVNWFSQSAPGVVPVQDSVISMTQNSVVSWYQVRRVGTDPAQALWVCQAFEIEEPA